MRRAAIVVVFAVALAGVGALSITTPARAECGFVPVAPATEAARSAPEIIVGTVTENVGGGQLYDFRLRIDHDLRGTAKVGEIRRFDRFVFGRSPGRMEDGTIGTPCDWLPGWKGDVIALALGAFAADTGTRYNAASWISGIALHHDEVPRTTLAEVRALTELPRTDAPVPEITAEPSARSRPARARPSRSSAAAAPGPSGQATDRVLSPPSGEAVRRLDQEPVH